MKAKNLHADERWLADAIGWSPLRTRPGRHDDDLYEVLDRIPRKVKQRLAGAGWLVATRGLSPDQLHLQLSYTYREFDHSDDAVEWFIRQAKHAHTVGVRWRNSERHRLYAKQQGAMSYYDLRDRRARAEGYVSLYAKRRALWT